MPDLNVEFGGITADNIEQLRKINTSCFPVLYNDSFYRDVVSRNDEDLCKFAYWNGCVIGALCTRIEPIQPSNNNTTTNTTNNNNNNNTRKRMYIMTLGVLAAYRGNGVGTKLVSSLLEYYENNKNGKLMDIDEISLHVQTSNMDAMKFYEERFGFERGSIITNYYKRIDPPHCYVLTKKLR